MRRRSGASPAGTERGGDFGDDVALLADANGCYAPDRAIEVGLLDPALTGVDGKVAIPDGPGWGVAINQSWLDDAHYQVSEAD